VSEAGDRFLIVRLGALGDVIHGIPAAAALRAAFPTARIDWLVDPKYVGLLGCVRGLDDRIGLDPRAGMSSLLSVLGELRGRNYSAAIDLQGLVKSAVLARLAGAGRTIGFARAQLREPAARFFYTSTVDTTGALHVIRQNLALLSAVGVKTDVVAMPLDVPSTVASQLVGEEFSEGYIVLNGGAAWPNKRWPPERLGAVAAALYARFEMRSVVLWGPGEQELATAIAAASAGTATLAPQTSIVDVLSIVRSARLVVSGDTGPVHLAGAVGTPVVGLYGPTNPLRNGPWSAADVVVSRYGQCSCRYQRRCQLAERCIDTITTADVIDASERRLTAPR
jgi:heptosyltransferase I